MNLRDVYFFTSLTDKEIARLKDISRTVKYEKDEILFYEGEKPKYLFILIEGIVKIYKSTFNKGEILISNFYPISMIAEMPSLEGVEYPATAVCETSSTIILIDFVKFENEFLKDNRICMNIIKSLTKKIKLLDNTITKNVAMSANAKVAEFIYNNENAFLSLKQKNRSAQYLKNLFLNIRYLLVDKF